MNLYQVVRGLEKIALEHKNVLTATDGSIYDVCNANPSVKYCVVCITQNTHRTDEYWDYYGLTIFYVDRLVRDGGMDGNRLDIQSHGKQVLSNIVHVFCDEYDVDLPEMVFTPFTQKFADETAGMYCQFELQIMKDIACAEDM